MIIFYLLRTIRDTFYRQGMKYGKLFGIPGTTGRIETKRLPLESPWRNIKIGGVHFYVKRCIFDGDWNTWFIVELLLQAEMMQLYKIMLTKHCNRKKDFTKQNAFVQRKLAIKVCNTEEEYKCDFLNFQRLKIIDEHNHFHGKSYVVEHGIRN